jgi:predicted DNA-binding protein with PD1-like motif
MPEMKVLSTEKSRHLLLRAGPGDTIPESLVRELRDQAVTCGWLRGSGVLTEVQLRAYDADTGGLGPVRRIAGPVHAVSLEGSVGLAAGDVSLGLRAVFARETDRGAEAIAGEILSARIVALEAYVAAFDELAVGRFVDTGAGVWLLGEPEKSTAAAAAPVRPAAWGEAIAASAPARPATQQAQSYTAQPIPPRPVRASAEQEEEEVGPHPEAGDFAEHFAFGPCDVIKSDGERIFLKLHKDGRIKEIALAMLRVSPLESTEGEAGPRKWRLQRKM